MSLINIWYRILINFSIITGVPLPMVLKRSRVFRFSPQADLSRDADWDEFADFQSCPPQPTAPSAGSVGPLTGADLSLMAATSSGTLMANGLPPPAAPLSYWGSPVSGMAGLSAPLSVLDSHPSPLASQGAPQTGLLCPSYADVNVGRPTEPAPAAGYTPVPAFRPAAKPSPGRAKAVERRSAESSARSGRLTAAARFQPSLGGPLRRPAGPRSGAGGRWCRGRSGPAGTRLSACRH